MEHDIWYASTPSSSARNDNPADQSSKCSHFFFRCLGDPHRAGYPDRARQPAASDGRDASARPAPSGAPAPAGLLGRARADVRHARHVAGVRGQRLRGRAEARVGLRLEPDGDVEAPLRGPALLLMNLMAVCYSRQRAHRAANECVDDKFQHQGAVLPYRGELGALPAP